MVNREERRWLVIMGVVILSITTIPYLVGYFQQGADWRFTGFLFGLEDGNSYIAKMLTGSFGSWLFRSPYSAIPQNGVVAFLPYILLGKLAFPPEAHGQLVVLFQVFRWVGGGLLIWSTYAFCSLFIENIRYRRITSLVILLGGGLGWTTLVFNPGNAGWGGSLEIYSPEAFGFLSLLGLPHLSVSRGLLLAGFIFFLRSSDTDKWLADVIMGGLCWLAVGFFQPLTIVIGYGILGCYLAFSFLTSGKNQWRSVIPTVYKTAVMGLIASPWVIYNFFFFNTDDYLQAWYNQNVISSPPVMDYALSFGIFFLAGLPALIHSFHKKDNKDLILPAWILCAGILAYFPYNLQRRFIDGVWVALVILIFMSLPLIQKKVFKQIATFVIGTTFIAPVLVMMVMSIGVMKPAEPVFRPAGEVRMYNALVDTVNPGDVILASYKTGNVLPAWLPVHVLAGHGPESVNLKTILPEVEVFYSGNPDLKWQREFLQQNNVDFIISGPKEKAAGTWQELPALNMKKIYDVGDYQVFRVENINAK